MHCLLLATVPAAPSFSISEYCNPLEVCIADPAALYHDGTYYLSGTGFARFVSRDLVNWERRGEYLQYRGSGLRLGAWASELHEKDGRFYYLFSAMISPDTKRSICVAVADSPATTFTKLAYPLLRLDEPRSVIDPHVFADNDGARYLFCNRDVGTSRGTVFVARLADDMTRLDTPLTTCIQPSQPWERRWQEGVWVTRHGDTYYMLWSSRAYVSPEYSVGFATAPSPFGPWTKYRNNPILKKTELVSGPGHCSLAPSPDGKETFMLYHCHRASDAGGERQLAIDRIRFEQDPGHPDRIVVDGPSREPRPYPSGAAPASVFLGRDDFTAPQFDRRRWSAVWNEAPSRWALADGALTIKSTPGQLHEKQADGQNVFLQYAPPGDWRITARVRMASRANFDQAFIAAWQDSNNYVALKKVFADGQKIEAAVELNEKYRPSFAPNPHGDELCLRLEKRGNRYQGFVSGDGANWAPVGAPMDAALLDIKVGFGGCCPESKSGVEARFDFFDLEAIP